MKNVSLVFVHAKVAKVHSCCGVVSGHQGVAMWSVKHVDMQLLGCKGGLYGVSKWLLRCFKCL